MIRGFPLVRGVGQVGKLALHDRHQESLVCGDGDVLLLGLLHEPTERLVDVRDIIGADNVLYLRLVKRADSYTAYCSVDGKKFEKIGTVGVGLKDIKAGLIDVDGVQAMRFAMPGGAAAPTVKPFKVAVDYFRVSK